MFGLDAQALILDMTNFAASAAVSPVSGSCVTDHDAWPLDQGIAAYRSQEYLEAAFRQAKDPHVVSFAPIRHFTDHKIRVHLFTCVLALAIAHLMRRDATHAGLTFVRRYGRRARRTRPTATATGGPPIARVGAGPPRPVA